MKCLLAIFSVILLTAQLLQAETIALIQKTGIGKDISYELVTPEAMKEMQTSAMESAKRFSGAVTEAEKEWKADPALKNYAFPKTSMAAPKISQAGLFTSAEKANSGLEEMKKKLIKPEPIKTDDKKKPAAKKPVDPTKLSPEALLKRAVALVESRMAAAPPAAGTTAQPAPAGTKGTAVGAGGYGVRNDAEDLQ